MTDSQIGFERIRPLAARIGLSVSAIRRKESLGQFPKHVLLGDGNSPHGYLSTEVEAWIAAQIARRDGPVEVPAAGEVQS